MTIKNDHQLIQQVLDGSIGHEGFKSFQMRLRREPDLVALYRQYALLHHALCEEFEGKRLTKKPVSTVRRGLTLVAAGLAMAAVIALLASLVLRLPDRHPLATAATSGATATFSEDAVWGIEGEQHAAGLTARLAQGAIIRLQQGQARITLSSGAVAVIDGNTELEFVSDEKLRLGHGRGRFRLDAAGQKFAVATSSCTVVDLGTEFGMESHPGRLDAVHVFQGHVEMQLSAGGERTVLGAGSAARVSARNTIESIPISMARFPQAAPRFVPILEDRFDDPAPATASLDHRNPRQGRGTWRVAHGQPTVRANRLEAGDFEAFVKLPDRSLSASNPILLATLETLEPLHGKFHTDGWSGMSFYRDGQELLFFGDAYGPEQTWSIDVKQGLPIALPKSPVIGPRTVTLCYNRNTGAASLHEGSLPLGPPFCSGLLPTGLEFDEIRIGASAQAALALRSLTVRTGESAEEAK
ncbi:MAG: FecR domain-containing protein [Verrucomicrobiota bacterium]